MLGNDRMPQAAKGDVRFFQHTPMKKAVRLLGVSVSGFVEEETDAPVQIALEL
jgi:hypothetical protein